ncbi:MAG: PilN domain-containing protein, partial [Firmicutes bacterium]|nr:PilN domain-containing protein [Bacillota bacterium]
MAIPTLKLNLASPPTFWHRHHRVLGWTALGVGALTLLIVGGLTWRAYHLANRMGQEAFRLGRRTQDSQARQSELVSQLRTIDVQKELPRWRLAERILTERGHPWSRITAELERSLVKDVRIKTLQRTKGSDQHVVLKLKGEARTREAEAALMASLQRNPFFTQAVLEREAERQGGGVDFEFTLPVSPTPPVYAPLPKFGPAAPSSAPRNILPTKTVAVPVRPTQAPVRSVATPQPTPVPAPQSAPQPALIRPPSDRTLPGRVQPPARDLPTPSAPEDEEARR